MNNHSRPKAAFAWIIIGLLSLALQSCGGGGGGSTDTGGGPVGPSGDAPKTELTDTVQLTTDSYFSSASNDAGQVLVLVAHEDSSSSGTTEIRALQYTPSGGWEKPITVASGKTVWMASDVEVTALVLSESGDAVFAWTYKDMTSSVVGYDLWTVARVGGMWQAPTLLTSKIGINTYSLAKDPSNQSVASVLWNDKVSGVNDALYFSRYRSASGWDSAEPVPMSLGSETSITIYDSKLGMDNAGNQYIAVTGAYSGSSSPSEGIRVRKRTITGWEDPQQIYTYDQGIAVPFVIHFAVASSGKAMIAYSKTGTLAENFAPYFRTFSFDGILWSGNIDTPFKASGELVVDNTGSAALVSGISGACFKPGTGWSSVAATKPSKESDPLWSPCLDTGGVATWSDVITSADKTSISGYWAAKIGAAGWSQKHLLKTGTLPIKNIHFGKGSAVVVYEELLVSPAGLPTLWLNTGRWTPPIDW